MKNNEITVGYTSFLGTGWSFPPEFISKTSDGEVLMTSDEADIDSSLRILLGTTPGERFLSPKFGLDMRGLLFDPLSTTMQTLLKERIRNTILLYESRITLLSLMLDMSEAIEGKVSIILDYEVRSTNSRFNLVYPFYRIDSNELRKSIDFKNS